MRFRHLGNSGLKISEITYGNWLTHGSQVENDTATATIRAALEAGITSFDTADAYANTVAEEVLGAALTRRRSRRPCRPSPTSCARARCSTSA
jgi:aryl-alcohol dehydrogenase-like predicted oxidoreductase